MKILNTVTFIVRERKKKTARSSAAMSLLSAVEYSPRWPFVLQDAHSCVNDRG